MRLEQVLHGVRIERRGGATSAEVRAIAFDSREVTKGTLFVAMRGGSADGSRFVSAAVAAGAVAVVTDAADAFVTLAEQFPKTPLFLVPHGRRALAALAANLYNDPQEQLALTGITGTNGKTTTAFLLDAMLHAAGRTTVLVGTIEYHVGAEVRPAPHTTPESSDLLRLLAEGAALGAGEAVMEVSSHALEQGRVYQLPFDVAVFTNLTQDHLDYHQTMEKYFAAKRALFDGGNGAPPRVAVVNLEDEYSGRLALAAREGGRGDLFLRAGDRRVPRGVSRAVCCRHALYARVALRRRRNCIAADGRRECTEHACRCSGGDGARAHAGADSRRRGSAASCAGTLPDGEARAAVYGGGGLRAYGRCPAERDCRRAGVRHSKCCEYRPRADAVRLRRRPRPGASGRAWAKLRGAGSDLCVLTSDNPRSEDPLAILDDVLPGLKESGAHYLVEPDRAEAIRLLLAQAKPGDIVLIAGKGHEKTQTIGADVLPFDDVKVAGAALAELGYAEGAR